MEKTTKKTKLATTKKSPVKKAAPKKVVAAESPETAVKKAPKKVEKEVVKEVQKKAVVQEEKKASVVVEPKKAISKKTSGAAPLSHGVGRRKCAVARVWVRPGSGSITVNDRDFIKYFDTQKTKMRASEPFNIIKDARRYDVVVNVKGGGIPGQADAVCLGLARALLNINEAWRPSLRRAGLLTVDARVKERKKYGQKAARRKFQFVKR
ncbi:TPA: 30S ribosomal protein S9 [Candidatus Dependentiae bacterium]|nr:MAG: 30S ribosomal protein S9 [candidate division TM6 bacterium GW2011_GWF2_36_131]KKQ02714.1 MAG: 30S ribosomal protein S9 [candidate division TM6 bacterium GW2011_GWE2_36_25]KKQ19601.1 MAG: 30S ribosomal protein S9 [candidate division TM6 bacterium GW2011_GWA2_36_9]HBR71115.1 30S ribosomal protein S9 [Candidatus Dependentiae bacterium]HCU00989.1 30S ribosomal protein S9 [Candidatus Dependentiae bacterium]